MSLDEKTQKAIATITDGTLASTIKTNMRYAATGGAIGAALGIGIATFMNKGRIAFGLGGAVMGAGFGYSIAPKQEPKENEQATLVKK